MANQVFNQQTFLGATIRSFNCNGGWNRQASTLTVSLVEDPENGDQFENPQTNTIHKFSFTDNINTWIYWGILTNIDDKRNDSENNGIEVVLTDPRVFLSGVQLILDGYTGSTFGVPNLYNLYGYLEDIEFGYSQKTESGIPFTKVLEAIIGTVSRTPISYRNETYILDLDQLPPLPISYRFSSSNITLMDFIEEVCEVANYDYMIELVGNIIKLKTISKNQPYDPGSIKRFISSLTDGYSSATISLQAEYNVMNKFIVGPQVDEMFFSFINFNELAGTEEETQFNKHTITQFWGLDRFGNIIYPNNIEEFGDYSVTVEGFSITDPRYLTGDADGVLSGPSYDNKYRDFRNGYTFTIQELRAALVSQESWEAFILFNDYIVPENLRNVVKRSLHEGKVKKIGMYGEVPTANILNLLFTDRPLNQFGPAEISRFKAAATLDNFSDREEYVLRVYNFVRKYAEEYFGVKFLISVPDVSARYNEYNEIETSLSPTDSGYIEESLHIDAAQKNMLPYYIDLILNDENKLLPFCKYDFNALAKNIDEAISLTKEISVIDLPDDSFYIGNLKYIDDPNSNDPRKVISLESLFIRCELEPKLVFENLANAIGPKAVLVLPGAVRRTFENGPDTDFVLRDLFNKKPGLNENEVNKQIKEFKSNVGADNFSFAGVGMPIIPNMTSIPLRNNRLNYGPWYTQNGKGKVEFIKNEELAPWNFGGFEQMNNAGLALVSEITEPRFFSEAGVLSIPGIYKLTLGDLLIDKGPVITNISVDVSQNGVVTNYRMDRWDMKYGRNNSYFVDQTKKLNDIQKEQKRTLKELFKREQPIFNREKTSLTKKITFPRRRVSNSSSQIICGNVIKKDAVGAAGEFYESCVASMPLYTALDTLTDVEWERKGGMSMDGLYRPFAINDKTGKISSYEKINSGIVYINNETLNPFQEGNDISIVLRGSGVPEELSKETFKPREKYEDDYRPIALRGPLVLAGWGYDINGRCVPEEPGSSPSKFLSGYLQKSPEWKVGPVDLRWNDKTKLWTSHHGNLFAEIYEDIPAKNGDVVGQTNCTICDIDDEGNISPIDLDATVYNIKPFPIKWFVNNYHIPVLKIDEKKYICICGGEEEREIPVEFRITENKLEVKLEKIWVNATDEYRWLTLIQGEEC